MRLRPQRTARFLQEDALGALRPWSTAPSPPRACRAGQDAVGVRLFSAVLGDQYDVILVVRCGAPRHDPAGFLRRGVAVEDLPACADVDGVGVGAREDDSDEGSGSGSCDGRGNEEEGGDDDAILDGADEGRGCGVEAARSCPQRGPARRRPGGQSGPSRMDALNPPPPAMTRLFACSANA